MLTIKALTTKGIHEVFDTDMENSYEVQQDKETIGYVCFRKSTTNKKEIWMEFIMAKYRGRGDGETILRALFEQGYEKINGTAIYGPHLFWESMGAVFEDEVNDDLFEGTYFYLTKEAFDQKGR